MYRPRRVNMLLRGLTVCLAFAAVLAAPAAAQTRLLMLEQAGCGWCAQWDAEVGTVYARTAEGRRAPLLRHDIFEPLPEDITLDRRAHFTPTFVLVDAGEEVGRIEGYPGEDFFYGLLQRLLERAQAAERTAEQGERP